MMLAPTAADDNLKVPQLALAQNRIDQKAANKKDFVVNAGALGA
jgi:hypothetical protein